MESLITESNSKQTENQDVNNTESAENFQKFIYELFDKNGILNDLRGYLRGHIVNVLQNAQTGDPPTCQKYFTQRLDSTFQALNILVAEYLLCLEFNYSLSVFVSEIPLANMVFGFAKSLTDLGGDGKATGLRFGENDVCSILNYLGIKCDAEHVTKIVDMYKTQVKSPLLLCILKCVQLLDLEQLNTAVCSEAASVPSSNSSNTEPGPSHAQCQHFGFCKACRRRYRRVKDKYRDKKRHYIQNVEANVNALNVETLMKNIGVLERSLIDEMCEELKAVHETEMDMFKAEHDDRIKNSLASHVQHFQRMKDELEASFKAREAALETNIEHKKRFLWGLAQALRVQHSQMTKAMQAVKKQTAELANQEQNLKTQRTEAEESLKKRAEEMRQKIAEELNILERHSESMKTERDIINLERCQLDTVNSETKVNNNEVKNYLQTHYDLLKDELSVVKMYIENATFRPRILAESGTNTEDLGYRGMNNEAARVVKEVKPKQVVNDLKKQKNVNFSPQCKTEGESSVSSVSSSSEDLDLARQARMSILSAQARQQAGVRPRTAPAAPPSLEHSMRESINESGWRKGAGEERILFANTQILVPGDTLPFVGIIEHRTSGRRHLINRWRAIRRRASPLGNSELASKSRPMERPAESVEIRIHKPPSDIIRDNEKPEEFTPTRDDMRSEATTVVGSQKTREKSPRSVLKEAKEKLKTVTRPSTRREKSPSAMLREAKMRLRKLEIEAEAVARSYRDFRRRAEQRHPDVPEQSCTSHPVRKLETLHSKQMPEHSKSQMRATNSVNFDLEKYLKKYQIDLDLGQYQFSNKNTTAVLKNPVPKVYSEIIRNVEPIPKQDYLEKPIHEFRKLYYPDSVRIHTSSPLPRDFEETLTLPDVKTDKDFKEKISEMKSVKYNQQKELELLNQNISKIHDLQEKLTKETVLMSKAAEEIDIVDNLLRVEVENVSEIRELKAESSQTDMIVIVEGSVDTKEIMGSEDSDERVSTKMSDVLNPNHIDEPRNTTDLLGSVDSKEVMVTNREDDKRIFTKMSIEISPKQIDGAEETEFASQTTIKQTDAFASRSPPSLQIANISYNNASKDDEPSGIKDIPDNDIDVEIRNDPQSEVQPDTRKDVSDTDEALDDYPEDFSCDVDNYKSDNTPISLPKTSEDETFWD